MNVINPNDLLHAFSHRYYKKKKERRISSDTFVQYLYCFVVRKFFFHIYLQNMLYRFYYSYYFLKIKKSIKLKDYIYLKLNKSILSVSSYTFDLKNLQILVVVRQYCVTSIVFFNMKFNSPKLCNHTVIFYQSFQNMM